MKFIVLVVIVLAVITVAQIMRVYELSAKVSGKREEDIDLRTNNINANLMLVFLLIFFGSFIWMFWEYGNGMLPPAASVLGEQIEWLFNVNWVIVIAIFFLSNGFLFIFAWKYSYQPDRKAHWFPHDNRLEMIWTVVPAATLAVIIIIGLMTWNDITGAPSDDAVVIEVYGKQFKWTARYSGDDNKLGYADYKLVGKTDIANSSDKYVNTLGIVTDNSILWRIQGINDEIQELEEVLYTDSLGTTIMSEAKLQKSIAKVEKLERIREYLLDMVGMYSDSVSKFASDDYITNELVFIKDQEYFLVLRSEDVLHSAYFPHFRAQMNCMPGQRTSLKITPNKTTAQMRLDLDNPDFNYILMCNKICGVSHSNMYMMVTVVEDQAAFDAWQKEEGTATPVLADIPAPTGINFDPMEMPTAGHGEDHAEEHHD